MRKHTIHTISHTPRNTLEVLTVPSIIGTYKGTHNMANSKRRIEFDPNLDIKIGDIVRCDGLPFKAKPATYYEFETIKFKIPSYKPFQLNNGYWVLRKAV